MTNVTDEVLDDGWNVTSQQFNLIYYFVTRSSIHINIFIIPGILVRVRVWPRITKHNPDTEPVLVLVLV